VGFAIRAAFSCVENSIASSSLGSMKRSALLSLFILILISTVSAEIRLPAVFADHMVVQRDRPVHVWGWAAPGESVKVSFRGENATVTADQFGHWSASLKPGAAGGPFELNVSGTNSIAVSDVLVGDVWFASGQSNMEFKVKSADNAAAEVAAANYPKIRLFQVEHTVSEYPLDDVMAKTWVAVSPETVANFSAVAYYFARDIQKRENVPIGLIESDWGGTPAESWTSLAALSSDSSLMPVFAARAKMAEGEIMNRLIVEQENKETARAKAEGRPAPKYAWHPPLNSWEPSALYNAMVAPVTPFPIRGVLWYQGESNSVLDRAPSYARLFQTMIQDWRRRWNDPDLPFLFVQISNFTSTDQEDWPIIREAQRRALELRNTAMAVTIDIGNPDDVHPTNKQEVARRLALAARAIVYRQSVQFSGPLYRQATREGNQLRVWFDHASALSAKGGALSGWEAAGADGKFVPATATIDGNTVLVTAAGMDTPRFVRYGWANSPVCNLYNSDGLPASPFRSGP
jgi:sialate O-acetylesterase